MTTEDRSNETLEIPLLNEPRQSFTTVLAQQECLMRVWWQPLDEHWYINLEYPPGTPVVTGRRLLTDQRVIGSVASDFSGDLIVRSRSGDSSQPGVEAWTTTHGLVYAP